jgi:small subunit ribosomal protein S2
MIRKSASQISLMSLFQVGAHRGNKKSKLNPRLKKLVFGYDKGLCLINLATTKHSIDLTADFLFKLGQKKRQLLIVGTSKHLQSQTKAFAQSFVTPMPYVDIRWPGGALTNFVTIKKTLKLIEKLNNMVSDEEFFSKLPKNQQLETHRELEKKKKIFDGMLSLKTNRPGAVIVLDANENDIAVKEAEKRGIPVIALTNTSTTSLPLNIDNTVLTNIYSIKGVELILNEFVSAYNEGYESEVIIDKEQAKSAT